LCYVFNRVTQLLRRQHCAKRAIESVAGMPYPTKYTRQYDFQSYQVSNPTRPLPGNQVNIDLDTVKLSVKEIIDFLKTSIRSDGRLANGSVGVNQLDATFQLGFSLPTTWESGVDYTTDSTVFHDNRFYTASVDHTSTDGFDESKWDLIVDFGEEADAAAASAAAALASQNAASSSASTATTQAGNQCFHQRYGSVKLRHDGVHPGYQRFEQRYSGCSIRGKHHDCVSGRGRSRRQQHKAYDAVACGSIYSGEWRFRRQRQHQFHRQRNGRCRARCGEPTRRRH
jgi:hypothetical protein